MIIKRQTREQLEATIADLRACNEHARMELKAAQQVGLELRKKLDEVKESLALAEAELQRAGGYIQRVQEDDVVREELVTVGEIGAEQQLVPKRKPTFFPILQQAPLPYGRSQLMHEVMNGCSAIGERPGKHRHWVTY